ncbi:unnamed protein product [Meganyctiphanes norvegica]|uniref:Uncharacterized protein n=1 Tax=Meganyctiphanes norvegica TaxID=48144 RepID=A0AAV2QW23_MEGNR
MSLTMYPMSRYCPTLYSNQNYCPSSAYRKYRRVHAMSGTTFEYFNPMSVAKIRPLDMQIHEPSVTQSKYAAVNRRVRERSSTPSSSRSRASMNSDRWSVGPGDLDVRPDNADLKLARRHLSEVVPSNFEDYPPVRACSNQYECLTNSLVKYGGMRHCV